MAHPQHQRPSVDELSQVEALAGLQPTTLVAISEMAQIRHIDPTDMLYHDGEEAHAIYVVLRGGVRLMEHTDDGKDVGLKLYGAGDLFGLLALGGVYTLPSRVEALLPTDIMCLHRNVARQVMYNHPDFALRVVDLLIAHVHMAHARVREMATERIDRRLARTLLKYGHKFGQRMNNSILIDIPITQQDLANFIGATNESVNRTLKQWDQQKIVAISRMRIEILDWAQLIEIAENHTS